MYLGRLVANLGSRYELNRALRSILPNGNDVRIQNEVCRVSHKGTPFLKFLAPLVGGCRLAFVFVGQGGFANAIWIISAFFGPGREGRTKTVHGHMAVVHALQDSEHRHIRKTARHWGSEKSDRFGYR